MSKFPNIFIPALGGSALVLGIAFAMASRDYGADKIETLETRVTNAEAGISEASEQAEAESARASELEQIVAELQAAAADIGERDVQLPGVYGAGDR